ncbi:alpha/beta hydrolase [Frigoribacterium sp. PvP032]|uniref:RBBP9/YdeN family alpha/beta hydrolase n=1 Tax=Frigoribacterium sp. PvP032 TaxID=2806589 RepID=UPI001AEB0136|nr:alpha/beta hydrolase [Frigoribacterium sp. PvP032]MBP1190008.1 putative alpha/beta hydrolase family esterase [Frigoribacterium sp. PvP032]
MTTSAPGFLLLHGWQNRRPVDHWQHQLAEELRGRGLAVRYPQLPSPDEPDPAAWEAVVRSEHAALGPGPVTVVCHSLSTLLWLRIQAGARPLAADRVALVSPPSPELIAGQDAVHAFVDGGRAAGGDAVGAETASAEPAGAEAADSPEPAGAEAADSPEPLLFDGRLLGTGAVGDAVVVAGDDDPWLPLGLGDTWRGRLDARQVVVRGGGHLTPDSGYGPWPAMTAWALGQRGEVALG